MAKKTVNRKSIQDAYISSVLDKGHKPESVYKFVKELDIDESRFYEFFGSFTGLEQELWNDFMQETLEAIQADKAYSQFSVREKLLAFYYTHIEILKKNRSFILVQMEKAGSEQPFPGFLRKYRNTFADYCRQLVKEGLDKGEIANRKYLTDNYDKAFWVQLLFVLKFWTSDNSAGFEQTDAAIEKAVNLSFDLIGKGPIESIIDFAKFVAQKR